MQTLRVLTVARWYPSHDSPGRGSFVADLVRATVAAGVNARIVSFDRVLVRGRVERRDADRAPARAAFDQVGTPAALFVTPVTYGAPGVAVARLPVVRRPGSDDAAALVEDHLDAFRPFVRRLIAEWRPDLIHAHTGLPDGVVAAAVGRELGIPVVVSEHASTIEAELADRVAIDHYRSLLGPGVRLLAVSPSLAGRVARVLGVSSDRVGLLPNPVAVGEFQLADPSRRDPDELLWVGSLGAHKGIEVLLRAFALVRASRPGVHLRLVGAERTAGERVRWATLADSLGVATAVAFDGWLDRAGVAAAMARAGVFVHPSPSETFGLAAAEAILSGLPVAARRSGGVPWIIELSGGYGQVAEADDSEAFAAAIERALVGPLGVSAAGASERLIDVIGEAAIAQRTIELYRSAIAEAGATTSTEAGTSAPSRAADLPYLLLATGRDQARRLVAELPVELQARLVLVLPAPIGPADDPSADANAVVTVVEAEPVPPPKRRPRGRGPLARLERAFFQQAPTADELLAKAIFGAPRPTGHGGPVEIVAIDAPAAAFVGRLHPKRARLAPGALRWLADRWDAEARPPR